MTLMRRCTKNMRRSTKPCEDAKSSKSWSYKRRGTGFKNQRAYWEGQCQGQYALGVAKPEVDWEERKLPNCTIPEFWYLEGKSPFITPLVSWTGGVLAWGDSGLFLKQNRENSQAGWRDLFPSFCYRLESFELRCVETTWDSTCLFQCSDAPHKR